jgi:hypothetical protein
MHTLGDWQSIFRLELERLATCFHDDFRMTSSRPSAPIDMLLDQVSVFNCPLLFKCFVAEAFELIEKQRGRSGISLATNAQIETTLGTADRVFDQLKIDLASVFDPSDLLMETTPYAHPGGSKSLIDRKLNAIDRIVGHPLANQDRQWRFARWSSNGTLNERLFPKEFQLIFTGGNEVANLPIEPATPVLCLRLERSHVSTDWGTLINSTPIEDLFWNDVLVLPLDVHWIVAFFHEDAGVFASRKLDELV